MSDFHTQVNGLESFVGRMKGANAIVTDELKKAGQRAGLAVEAKAKGYAPVWRGHLRRSITSVTTTQSLYSTTKVGTSAPYARPVEFGRGAGKTPPPMAPIADWLASKGGDPKAAFAVARAIGRRGIPGRPFLTRAFNELKPQIRAEFNQVPKRIIARLKGAA